MATTEWYEPLLDGGWVPDPVLRMGIRAQVDTRKKEIFNEKTEKALARKIELVNKLRSDNIAIDMDKANEQHYEISTDFMRVCLGPRMKYSCCYYPTPTTTLEQAEECMLDLYTTKAELKDGMDILDLGCGWGSLCLYLAQRYPKSNITALSNSRTQKIYIDNTAKERGLQNLKVVTADVTTHDFKQERFDRVMSIEMFEHMKNYSMLLQKVSTWLKDEGKLFIHIFCHKSEPYEFIPGDGWMQKFFFTGGTMPSSDLFLYFQEHLSIENMWWVPGYHYSRSAEDWIKLMYKNKKECLKLLERDYGKDMASVWFVRWKVFYMAISEMFNYKNGEEWGICLYLFTKKQ